MPSNPTVTVTIDKVRWIRVQSFSDSGPDDRHYVVKTIGDKTTIYFGDGIHGAVPTPGSTIEAGYRTVKGLSGNNVSIIFPAVSKPFPDESLWIAIRNRTKTASRRAIKDK